MAHESPRVQEVIDLVKAARAGGGTDLTKAWTQSGTATSGITEYDLEAGAKKLIPVITPLRNDVPRVSGKGGIQANWRAITGININNLSAGLSQGKRGGVVANTTKDYTAVYRGIGLEDYVDFEAQYAAEGFDNVMAIAQQLLLWDLMIQEEKIMLWGNTSTALGTTPTPTVAGVASGGALADATYSVICVALTPEGLFSAGGPGVAVAATVIPQLVTRNLPSGDSDSYGGGAAKKSASATGVVSGGSGAGSVTATVAAVNGAAAYAWFFGAAGAEVLHSITTINSQLFKAAGASSQTAASVSSATDNSTNGLIYDGFMTIAYAANSGAYIGTQATGTAGTGTPLTADGAGGIIEIDLALKSLWDNYRLSPDEMWVHSQEQTNIYKKVLAGSSTSAQRFVFDSSQGLLAGGTLVTEYLNKYTMTGAKSIPIKLHPNMVPGTILMRTKTLPYPLSNVTNVAQIRARREYYSTEWPLIRRRYEYGVYADEVLQHYFPPSLALITNIANG